LLLNEFSVLSPYISVKNIMGLNIHIHHHTNLANEDLALILELLTKTNLKLNTIMAKQQDFDAVLSRIDAATTNLATVVTDLKDDIKELGLPGETEDAILSKLDAAAAKLEAIGKPEDPAGDETPDVPTEPIEEPTEPVIEEPTEDEDEDEDEDEGDEDVEEDDETTPTTGV
jgi:hypothetical protein